MFITDNVEVFVVRHDHPNTFRTEYISTTPNAQGIAREQTFVAAHDNEGYGIAIVFGKDFEISPTITTPEVDCKESAVRVRIVIDGGIAVKQRIYKESDLAARPGVHFTGVFKSASVTKDDGLRYRLLFAEVPGSETELPPLLNGAKMSSALRHKIGNIDVELERGYLDFDKKIERFEATVVEDAFNPRWFASSKNKVNCFRTKLRRYRDEEVGPSLSHGTFRTREAAKRLRISYCSESLIQVGLTKKKIVPRPSSDSWHGSIRVLEEKLAELMAVSVKPIKNKKHAPDNHGKSGETSKIQSSLEGRNKLSKGQRLRKRKKEKEEEQRQKKTEMGRRSSEQPSPMTKAINATNTILSDYNQALSNTPSKRKNSTEAGPEIAKKRRTSAKMTAKSESSPRTAADAPSTSQPRRDSAIEVPSTPRSSQQRRLPTGPMDFETIKAIKQEFADGEDTPCKPAQKKVSMIDLTQDLSSDGEESSSDNEPLATKLAALRDSCTKMQKHTVSASPAATAADTAKAFNDPKRLSTKPAIAGSSTTTSSQPAETTTDPSSSRTLQNKSATSSAGATNHSAAVLGEANSSSPSKGLWQPQGQRVSECNTSKVDTTTTASNSSTEQQTLHEVSSSDLRVRLAKLNYELVLEDTAVQKQSEEVVLMKKIECREGQIELYQRELRALRESLAGKRASKKT